MRLPGHFRSADNQQAPGQEWPPLSGSQTENHRLGQPAIGAVAMTIGRLTRREASDNPDVGTPLRWSGVRAFVTYERVLSPISPLPARGLHELVSRFARRTGLNHIQYPPLDPPLKDPACHRARFAVLSDLPIERLTRATRIREVQARRRAKTSSNSSFLNGCTR